MRNRSLILLVLMLNVFNGTAQENPLIPSEIPWHSETAHFDDIKFSFDGRYLITKGTDKRLIISDLKTRLPFFSLDGVNQLLVSEKSLFFYVSTENTAGGHRIQKRSIEDGQLILEFVIPSAIDNRSIGSTIFALDESNGTRLLVPYANFSDMVIHAFDESGKRLQFFGPFKAEQITAIISEKSLLVLTTGTLYEVDAAKIHTRLKAPSDALFGNMKLRNDTLHVLSNRKLQAYNIKTWKVAREINTPFFAYSEAEMGIGSFLTISHDFGIDKAGKWWLVNTRSDVNINTQKRLYPLARLQNDVTYPLATNSNPGRIVFERLQPDFALHAKQELLALNTSGTEIVIYHLQWGELFRLDKRAIQFDGIHFTNTPGRVLLLQHHSPSRYQLGIFLDLSTGRQEAVDILDEEDLPMFTRNRIHHEQTNIKEKLYVPYESNFQSAEYLTHEQGQCLMFDVKDQHDQDTLYLKHSRGNIEFSKTDGHLQWLDLNGRRVSNFFLKTPAGKPIHISEYIFTHYTYDSIHSLLTVSYRPENHQYGAQFVIDVASKKVIKTLHTEHPLTLLTGSQYYVNNEGCFEFKTDKKISGFPEQYPPSWFRGKFSFHVTNDRMTMIYVTWNDEIVSLDLKTGTSTLIGVERDIEKIVCDPHSNKFFTIADAGHIKIWETDKPGTIATLTITGKKDIQQLKDLNASYVVQLPDGYFMGDNRYFDFLSLRLGNKIFPLQAMDNLFNRPDKILKSLGYAEKNFTDKLETILKQRKQVDLKSRTDVMINNKSSIPFMNNGKVALALALSAPLAKGEGLMIYVNGSSTSRQPFTPPDLKNVVVELVDPVNSIRVSVVDVKGSESPGDFMIVNSTSPRKTDLYVVSIGVSKYANPTYNLKYARKDATEINKHLQLMMSFNEVKTIEFYDEKVDYTILNSIQSFLGQAKIQDQVIIYYAGHGLLNKSSQYFLSTHKIDFSDPAANGIPLDTLLNAIAHSPSRKKMVMLDACNSGLVDDMQIPSDALTDNSAASDSVVFEHRGVEVEVIEKPNYSTLYFTVSTAASANGVSVIAAAAGNEAALEGGGLQNGLFTYSFIKALESGEANINRDTVITLNELQSFLTDRVQSLSRGKQRPAFRQANIYYDAPVFRTEDAIFSHFIDAVRLNNLGFVNQLLKDGKVNINQRDLNDFTALNYSAREGSFKMTQLLLGYGADVNSSASRYSAYLAAWNGHDRVLLLLAVAGVDITALRKNPDIRAKNNAKVLRIIDHFDEMQANDKRHVDFINALCENPAKGDELFKQGGIDLNYKSLDGSTLLFQAISAKNYDCARWLIAHKADINLATDEDLFTPLMLAVYIGDIPFIRFLLQNGADKTKKDFAGRTALDFAKQFKNTEAEQILK